MSNEVKKEECENLVIKSFFKSTLGKLAILAAAATTLSSCHHTNLGIQISGAYHRGSYCGSVCYHGHTHRSYGSHYHGGDVSHNGCYCGDKDVRVVKKSNSVKNSKKKSVKNSKKKIVVRRKVCGHVPGVIYKENKCSRGVEYSRHNNGGCQNSRVIYMPTKCSRGHVHY